MMEMLLHSCQNPQLVQCQEWILDFPGGAVVKYSPANAEDMGSVLGLGRSPMPQLLKPTGLEPMLHNKRSHRNGKPAHNEQ